MSEERCAKGHLLSDLDADLAGNCPTCAAVRHLAWTRSQNRSVSRAIKRLIDGVRTAS